MKIRIRKVFSLVFVFFLICSFYMPFTQVIAQENTWTVNITGDTGSGSGTSGDLRYAITQAQLFGGGTIIFDSSVFNVSTSIVLQGPLPAIDIYGGTLDIQGPGSELLTISGNNLYGIFKVSSGNVSITGLTVAEGMVLGSNGSNGAKGTSSMKTGTNGGDGGISAGGAVYNAGMLTIGNCVFSNNKVVGGSGGGGGDGYDGYGIDYGGCGGSGGSGGNSYGGAVYNTGILDINYSTFNGNSVKGGSGGSGGDAGVNYSFTGSGGGGGGNGYGGAIYNTGSMDIENSTFSGDSATGGNGNSGGTPFFGAPAGNGGQGGTGNGGAIYNDGVLAVSIKNNLFSDNNVAGGTGGIGGMCNVAIGNSNSGNGGAGGSGWGGALYNAGTLAASSNTFRNNNVTGGNGGLGEYAYSSTSFGGRGGNGGSGGNGSGGAAYNSGTLSIRGGTLTGDKAAGGTGGAGGNGQKMTGAGTGGNGGAGGNGWGGVLYNTGSLAITGSWLSGDSAVGGAGGAAGLGYAGVSDPSPIPGTPGSGGSGTAKSVYNGNNSKTSALDVHLDTGSNTTFGALCIVSVSPYGVLADGTSQISVTSTVYNDAGTPEQGVDVAITTTLGNKGFTDPVITDANGMAAGTITSGTPGTATIQVQASGYPPVSTEVTFYPGDPSSILPVAGAQQTAQVGTKFSTALKVIVKDLYGNPVGGTRVVFTAPSDGAGGTFANGTTTYAGFTYEDGIVTAPDFTANSTAGSYTVTAGFDGASTPAGFTLTNVASPASYNVSVMANPAAGGTVEGGGVYGEGSSVHVIATANSGYSFACWKENNIPVSTGASYTFILGASDRSLTAYFMEISSDSTTEGSYFLTLTAGTGGSITTGSSGNYAAGSVIRITATAAANYRFRQWTSTGGGSFASTTSAGTTFTMPAAAAAVTASFTYSGGGDTGGNNRESGDGTSTPPVSVYSAVITGSDTTGNGMLAATLPVTVNQGSAVVDAGSQQGDIIKNGGIAAVTIPSIDGINSYTLGISAAYLSAPDGKGSLTFNSDAGNISLPANMLAGIDGAEGKKAEITIGKGDKSGLPEAVKAAMGDRPLIQLSVTLDGKQTDWNNPDAPATITIPYAATAAELANPESIVIWYIDGSGNAVSVPNGRYDPETGTVTFFTTHFSQYAVAYVHKTFSDLSGAEWARKAIGVMASKGITKGTGRDTFSPGANITRADYMVLLINTLGLTVSFSANFDDVKPDAYYFEAAGIAKKLGIAEGVGNNRFNPTENISRQDMMVLAARALEKYKGLKATNDNTVLEKFNDKRDIADYAVNSLATIVKEGLTAGYENKLNPQSRSTRAEIAVFLYRIYDKYPKAPVAN